MSFRSRPEFVSTQDWIETPNLPETLTVDGRDVSPKASRSSRYLSVVFVQALRPYDARIRHVRSAHSSSYYAPTESGVLITAHPPRTHALPTAIGKYKLIALTNNFARQSSAEYPIPEAELRFLGWDKGVIPSHLVELFDDFCDSSVLGMRWAAARRTCPYSSPEFEIF